VAVSCERGTHLRCRVKREHLNWFSGWLKPRPESGVDCRVCAMFARLLHRDYSRVIPVSCLLGREGRRTRTRASTPPPSSRFPKPSYNTKWYGYSRKIIIRSSRHGGATDEDGSIQLLLAIPSVTEQRVRGRSVVLRISRNP